MKIKRKINGAPTDIYLLINDLKTKFYGRGILINTEPNYLLPGQSHYSINIRPDDDNDWIYNLIKIKSVSENESTLTLDVDDTIWPLVESTWELLQNEFVQRGIIKKQTGKKGTHHIDTYKKVLKLSEKRREKIEEIGRPPNWIAACQICSIDSKTAIDVINDMDSELRTRWDDESYDGRELEDKIYTKYPELISKDKTKF